MSLEGIERMGFEPSLYTQGENHIDGQGSACLGWEVAAAQHG